MKVFTAAEMRKADDEAIRKMGIPSILLMENAATAVVSKILDICPPPAPGEGVTVAAGKGNNGGDAVAAARILRILGFSPEVFVFGDREELSPDAKAQVEKYVAYGRTVFDSGGTAFDEALSRSSLVIDGLLGTGARGAVSGRTAEIIKKINAFEGMTVSIDIPSGLSGDSFILPGPCVLADLTVTLGAPKLPLVSPECEHAVGRLEVADIGLPEAAMESACPRGEALDMKWAASFFRERGKSCHKGTQGHLLIISGSRGKAGAAVLSATGALRAGAGLVTVAVPEECARIVTSVLPEAMTLPLPATRGGSISREAGECLIDFVKEVDAVAVGPGLGIDPETAGLVRDLYASIEKPLALDADGINAFEVSPDGLSDHLGPRVLTPHPGELGRIIKLAPRSVLEGRYSIVPDKAREWNSCLLLKGYRSFMADGRGRWRINLSGGPHMASAGVGDVLTGIVGALLARGLEPFDALALGVFWHGAAADDLFRRSGYGMLASEIAAALPAVESRGRNL